LAKAWLQVSLVVLPAHVCVRGDFSPRDQSHPAFVTLPHQLKAEAANTGRVVGDESRLVPDQKAGVPHFLKILEFSFTFQGLEST